MKCRLIYDLCTPTADRRPTTVEDIENDIQVVELDSKEEILEHLLNLANYEEDELEEFDLPDDASIDDKIDLALGFFEDPGDGSPNILYLSIDGKEVDGTLPYDCLEDLDLETCTREDVIEACLENADDWLYDEDEDNDEDFVEEDEDWE